MNIFPKVSNRVGRFETLDGLRGFLALSVYIHHFVVTYYWKVTGFWGKPPEIYYENYGRVGVALFFILTGFLFVFKMRHIDKKIDWFVFYKSRFFRIIPLYLFVVLIVVITVFYNSYFSLKYPVSEIFKQIARWLIFYGGVINDFDDTRLIIAGVDWTLKYELFFYFSLPFIFLLMKYFPFFLFAIFAILLYFYIFPFVSFGFDSSYAFLFAIGGTVAFINNPKLNYSNFFDSRSMSFLTVATFVSAIFYPRPFDFFHLVLIALFFILIVFGNSVFGILKLDCVSFLGEISYSIYLLHGLVLYFVFTQFEFFTLNSFESHQFYFLLPFIGSIVIFFSSITYFLIEKPFVKLGRNNFFSVFFRRFFFSKKL